MMYGAFSKKGNSALAILPTRDQIERWAKEHYGWKWQEAVKVMPCLITVMPLPDAEALNDRKGGEIVDG